MKNILIIILVLFGSINTVNAQTESETIDFLNTMLVAHSTPLGTSPVYFKVNKMTDPLSNKKVIRIKMFVNNELFRTVRFHPEHISTVTTNRNEYGYSQLKIISPKGLILSFYESDKIEKYEENKTIALNTTVEEVNRIKKAFIHLLKLNNAPLIDDNLFKN